MKNLKKTGFWKMAILLWILSLGLSSAGRADAADWARNHGTPGLDAWTLATAVDAAGNVYVAGHFNGATFTLGGVTPSRIGDTDAFAAKLDAPPVIAPGRRTMAAAGNALAANYTWSFTTATQQFTVTPSAGAGTG